MQLRVLQARLRRPSELWQYTVPCLHLRCQQGCKLRGNVSHNRRDLTALQNTEYLSFHTALPFLSEDLTLIEGQQSFCIVWNQRILSYFSTSRLLSL